jgi:hypothetical protein
MGLLKERKDAGLNMPSGISFAVPVQFLRELIRTSR